MMIARWTRDQHGQRAGISSTWTISSRGRNVLEPGEAAAPERGSRAAPPINGIDIATEYAIASPIPESRSSTSE